MVGQERQRAPLIWRKAVSFGPAPTAYWELVREGASDFARPHALINKANKRLWVLEWWVPGSIARGMRKEFTYHKTLREAKAVGIVNVRFNQAENT